ncbi:MAG: hypothetical protein KDA80_09165, partial [Planctomycetaceae bacterium]|nr:hypothetical protein [Planctomycetaceae bacterium]
TLVGSFAAAAEPPTTQVLHRTVEIDGLPCVRGGRFSTQRECQSTRQNTNIVLQFALIALSAGCQSQIND